MSSLGTGSEKCKALCLINYVIIRTYILKKLCYLSLLFIAAENTTLTPGKHNMSFIHFHVFNLHQNGKWFVKTDHPARVDIRIFKLRKGL